MTAERPVNEVQELLLQLMELSSFNQFDGKEVAQSLRDNAELWTAALFGRFDTYLGPGIILRDLPDGVHNADTLLLTPAPGKDIELVALARTWDADEVGWETDRHCGRILSVWWD